MNFLVLKNHLIFCGCIFNNVTLVKMSLNKKGYNYISNHGIAKEMWDVFEKIYEVFSEIIREMMNTLDQKFKTPN